MVLDGGKAHRIEQMATNFDLATLAPVVTCAALFITLSILTISSNTLALALFDKTRVRDNQPDEKKKMLLDIENRIVWLQKTILGLFSIIIIFGFCLLMFHRKEFFINLFIEVPLLNWVLGLTMGYCFFVVTILLYCKLRYESTIRGSD